MAGKPDIHADRTTLLRLVGVHDPEIIRAIGEWFSISPLVLEDIMNTGQHPKLEWQEDDSLFIVLKDAGFDRSRGCITHEHMAILWKDDVVILFQEKKTSRFDGVLERVRKGRKIRAAGGSYLVVALLDAIIDKYYGTLEQISSRAEELETALERRQSQNKLQELYRLRRENIILRNTLMPIREMVSELIRDEENGFGQDALPYLRDVGDHANQVADAVKALTEIMQGMIELQISLSGMQANRIMQVLTLVATIFIPLTFVAGIYGMNFEYMPELKWHYGYFIILGVMGVLAVAMAAVFVRKRWF
ncbi:magnesium/cobalt transporter CorA [Salidesulfovibrio onnuriiensis]|uniref:magnesium/cobalt transporter CorA n=1 Tax=Salidesulfovibrio onnuriiensis TaxID=2583823 RepID=UPI00165001D8|nr:magnesium/cobalt transporter CorA [Salidesulfovibrio onnuriiensis]